MEWEKLVRHQSRVLSFAESVEFAEKLGQRPFRRTEFWNSALVSRYKIGRLYFKKLGGAPHCQTEIWPFRWNRTHQTLSLVKNVGQAKVRK